MRHRHLLSACALVTAALLSAHPTAPAQAAGKAAIAEGYPAAAHRPVVHRYHGVSISDDFEWLEDGSSADSKAWTAAQNRLSRSWLDALPGREALGERLKQIALSASNAYFELVASRGLVFAMKNQPPKQHPLLVTLDTIDDVRSERVVFDPNTEKGSDGRPAALAIDFFVPSPDGKRVALSVSENGSEDGTLRILDLATGKELGDRIPRVAFATGGGSVAWNAAGDGLYYTRYPSPGERLEADVHFFQQVWFHRLGQPVAQDHYETGQGFPRIAETVLRRSLDGRVIAALVANGDGGDFSLWLRAEAEAADARSAPAAWHAVAQDGDGIKALRFAPDGSLVLLSRDGAPKGKLIRLDATALARAASGKPVDWRQVPVVVPEGEGTIQNFVINGPHLVVADLVGGPSRLRSFSVGKPQAQAITLPPVSGIADLVDLGKAGVVAEVSSYLRPSAWMHVEAGQAPRASALVRTSAVNYADCEVIREFATSKDGTQVPINIVRRKGTVLNGRNPVLLYGYGGYGISETPRFSGSLRVFLDQGGIWADANLRGGGEFGEAWHRAGNLTNKQNVFDDFIAAAEHLIRRGYTSPQRLAIMGGSNGGLLMGAVLTQRPDLFRAVVSAVGIYDMLRVELDPNGAFNVTEFGSVQDPAQFKALAAYSPLHKVKDGTPYPAVLMQTGDNDGRVNPAHSRKMMARLQAADPTGGPFLLSTSATSGHGIGTALDERIGQDTDVWSFVIQRLITAQPAP